MTRLALTLCWLVPFTASGFAREVLLASGPSQNRIDLVILAEGYRAEDQWKFTNDAVALTNELFLTTPWREYAGLFNVTAVHVISNERGADYGTGTGGGLRDTALGAQFGCGGLRRALCADEALALSAASVDAPEFDVLVVLVNDPEGGGTGGVVATVSASTDGAMTLIHELGHVLGQLADEYDAPFPGFPSCSGECAEANVTANATATVKWSAWVSASTPLPTPELDPAFQGGTIGAFEGARYQARGLYRPTDAFCMMNVFISRYCSVCTEQLVKELWNRVTPIEQRHPSANSTSDQCATVRFQVSTVPVAGLQFSWVVDDAGVADRTPFLDLAARPLTVGLTVTDGTRLVRSDPALLLRDSVRWALQPTGACAPGSCDLEVSCEADGGCAGTPLDAGTACGEVRCSEGLVTAPACDEWGGCALQVMPCGPFACDDAGVGCALSCVDDTGCTADALCADGGCVLRRSLPPSADPAPPVVTTRPGAAPAPSADPLPTECGCSAPGAGGAALALAAWALRRRRGKGIPD